MSNYAELFEAANTLREALSAWVDAVESVKDALSELAELAPEKHQAHIRAMLTREPEVDAFSLPEGAFELREMLNDYVALLERDNDDGCNDEDE